MIQLFNQEKWRFQQELIPLLKDFPKESRILDLGCGSGSLLKALMENGFHQIKGVDLSPEQIEVAKSMGVTQAECAGIDEYLNNTPSNYDLIFGMDIIEHFTKNELVQLMLKLKSRLNRGGKIIFRTPNMDAILPNRYAYGDFTHECLLNASSASQLGLSCGFSKLQVIESNMDIRNPLLNWIRIFLLVILKLKMKVELFVTGRSSKDLIVSPNILLILEQ
ncbi:MAG: class I SAM-dependent methyltransferase [Saprospiraceae bacterium]|nr:class I SAM-dependent methyltransferase [Saprospiraceae bacterium]